MKIYYFGCEKGEEVAFELVFYRYKGKLYDFIRRSLPASEDAESMVQKIFVRLWSNREQLHPAKSLNSFIYTMAHNEIFGHLRKLLVSFEHFLKIHLISRIFHPVKLNIYGR